MPTNTPPTPIAHRCPIGGGARRIGRRTAVASLLVLWVATSGCGASMSQLVAGKRVKTGKRNYDNYFSQVSDISEKVAALDSDLFPLRQPLTETLDVDEDTSLPDLLYATKKRAQRLKGYGVIATLQMSSPPTVLLSRGKVREDAEDEALFVAVQESATRAMTTFTEYSAMLDEIVELDRQREPLAERAGRLGPNHPLRARIDTELVGAGKVLAKAEKKLLRDTRTIAYFLMGLAQAVDTGALEQHEAKCKEAIDNAPKKRRGKPSWRGRGRGRGRPRPRPGGRPRPRPKPKPAPAGGGGDFDM
ncbi:MAG TPA: hypothetical protein ENK23_08105 [Sorangium sp.]|nr:hypothetical protein [Sorangium sp.]